MGDIDKITSSFSTSNSPPKSCQISWHSWGSWDLWTKTVTEEKEKVKVKNQTCVLNVSNYYKECLRHQEVKPAQENTMCCSLFWIVYSRHLAVLVCKLMGVQSIWLFSPVQSLRCKPSTYFMNPSLSSERNALKNWKKKNPPGSHFWSYYSLLLF